MAKQKQVTAWCDRGLIVSPYYFALCLSEEAFQKELRHLKVRKNRWPEFMDSPSADATTHYFQCGDKHSAIVCVKAAHKRTAIAVAGILVHEAVHIWQAIKDVIGEHKPSPEFEAYSVQMLSQELFQRFAELGGKFK
jgi:hypothetical protein